LKIIILDHQNNYVGNSSIMSNTTKNLDILATSLSVLHNYFDSQIKLFLDLIKFSGTAKQYFPCRIL